MGGVVCDHAGVIQTNRLEFGWNLIAFQVVPSNASPGAVFATNMFRSVWTFDNDSGQWSQFGRATPGQPEQDAILPMGPVQAGRAYQACFDAGFRTNWAIEGLRPDGAMALNFQRGWNLIGVPAGGAADVNVVSIFKPGDLAKIELVARWEATSQRYQVGNPWRSFAVAAVMPWRYWAEFSTRKRCTFLASGPGP
jgi:hypothetical protein